MRKRLEYLSFSLLSWILIFQLFRLFFLFYQHDKSQHLPASIIPQIALHGLKMDLSFACYLIAIPTLLLAFTAKKWKWYTKFLSFYSAFSAVLVGLLLVSDLEVFRAWGFRIDTTPLAYLFTPNEAWASVSGSPLVFLFSLLGATIVLIFIIFQTIKKRTLASLRPTSIPINFVIFLFITAALIIPIRGGLQLAPMNQSTVYFSENNFANNAAVNACWNFFDSVLKVGDLKENPFALLDDTTAISLTNKLKSTGNEIRILPNDQKINILLIIWESFTAKAVGSLNGMPGITPNFEKLTKEGIYFRNVYASGNRSDKGMVAILSGYPAQPTTSIIKIPSKTNTLPSLPKQLNEQGYFTSFYYGGESEFANMKSYFLQQGFDRIIDKNQFDKDDMNSKWGAHDHIVFNRLIQDIDTVRNPFFTTLFTLSSHEPFEVPVPTAIKGTSDQSLFLNALHYTDKCLGDFINKAKTKPWWDSTLVIIVADHGHPMPKISNNTSEDFHIPMLWLGGALKGKTAIIDTLASQTDLAATLLKQLNLPANDYIWSTSIFQENRIPFAYFTYNNGFGWKKPAGYFIHDNVSRKVIEHSKGYPITHELNTGRAYLQTSYNDFLTR